jgi:hypothetical protein
LFRRVDVLTAPLGPLAIPLDWGRRIAVDHAPHFLASTVALQPRVQLATFVALAATQTRLMQPGVLPVLRDGTAAQRDSRPRGAVGHARLCQALTVPRGASKPWGRPALRVSTVGPPTPLSACHVQRATLAHPQTLQIHPVAALAQRGPSVIWAHKCARHAQV